MAGESNIAFATLSVIPSMRGVQGALEKQMGAPAEAAALSIGSRSGRGFVKNMLGQVRGIESGLVKEMGRPAEAAAVAAGQTASIGFNKALLGTGVAAAAVGFAFYKIGKSFDQAFDRIRVGTGKTGPALESLKGSFKNVISTVPTDFGKASDAIALLNERLGLTGKPLEHLSEQFLELSRLQGGDVTENIRTVTAAMNSWGISAADQGPKLDELFRVSQATGASVSELSSTLAAGGPVFRQVGLSFEQSAALLGLFDKAGVNGSRTMLAFSQAIAKAAKAGKPAQQVLEDTFAAIKRAPTDTAAAGAAVQLFGVRAGPQLAGLIRQGKLSFDDLARSISSGGDTILGAAKQTDDFAEKWQVFKNKILVGLEPLASGVFSGVSKAMDGIGAHVGLLLAPLKILAPTLSLVGSAVRILSPALFVLAAAWAANKTVLLLEGGFLRIGSAMFRLGQAANAAGGATGLLKNALAGSLGTAILLAGAVTAIVVSVKAIQKGMEEARAANEATNKSFLSDTIPTLLKTGGVLKLTAEQWRSGPFGGSDINKTKAVFEQLNSGTIGTTEAFRQLKNIAGVTQEAIDKVVTAQIDSAVAADKQKGSYTDVANAVVTAYRAAGTSAATLGASLRGLSDGALEKVFSALEKDGLSADDLSRIFNAARPNVGALGNALTTVGTNAKTAATKILGMTQADFKTWSDKAKTDINFVSGSLTTLGGNAKVTAKDILKAFTDQLTAMSQYRTNFDILLKRHIPNDLAVQLESMGQQGAGIVAALAHSNDKQFNAIVTKWNTAGRTARGFPSSVQAMAAGVNRAIASIQPRTVTIAVAVRTTEGTLIGGGAVRRELVGFASGGLVPGAPGQPIPAIVHGGEYVLSRAALRALANAPRRGRDMPITIEVHQAGQDTRQTWVNAARRVQAILSS
jgi:hypothetical protein